MGNHKATARESRAGVPKNIMESTVIVIAVVAVLILGYFFIIRKNNDTGGTGGGGGDLPPIDVPPVDPPQNEATITTDFDESAPKNQ